MYDEESPRYQREILDLGVPVLGICYGAQLMAYLLGGRVTGADEDPGCASEYGAPGQAHRPGPVSCSGAWIRNRIVS